MGEKLNNSKCGLKDMSGLVFGRLTVLSRNGSDTAGARWDCVCSCGSYVNTRGSALRCGGSTSCGCYNRDIITTHNKSKSGAYKSWRAAKERCYVTTNKRYPRYGGRGIEMDDSWKDSFAKFYKDMGDRPEGTSLDRIDNSKGYIHGNCRWATPSEQSSNREYTGSGTSKFIGVRRTPYGKWSATITIPNKGNRYIGNFTTENGAAIAYNEKVVELELTHLRKLNIVDGGSYDNRAS